MHGQSGAVGMVAMLHSMQESWTTVLYCAVTFHAVCQCQSPGLSMAQLNLHSRAEAQQYILRCHCRYCFSGCLAWFQRAWMAVGCLLQAAFNLLVCCYALGDKEGMMAAFQRLLTVPGLAEAKALQVCSSHPQACAFHMSLSQGSCSRNCYRSFGHWPMESWLTLWSCILPRQ